MTAEPDINPTTEIEAVNAMLDAISETAVDTLDDNSCIESADALRLLRRESRALQLRGWSFNTEEEMTLLPVEDGSVPLPANTLSVTFRDIPWNRNYAYRAGKVYDRKNQTFTIGQTVTADVVVHLPFEDIPEAARWYITVAAARKLQDIHLGDGQLHQYGAADEQTAWFEFLSRETEDSGYNINRDSVTVSRVTRRWRPR